MENNRGQIATLTFDEEDCLIQGLPSVIEPCASYTIKVRSLDNVGHKLAVSKGQLLGHPSMITEDQNNKCRHRYSQVETKYVFRATEDASTYTFYSICGKINGPMNVNRAQISRSGTAFSSCSSTCNDPLRDSVEPACFPPTAAPVAAPPGTATNDRGSEASSLNISPSLVALMCLIVFVATVF